MKSFNDFKLQCEETLIGQLPEELSIEQYNSLDEDTQALYELSKSTLASYIKKASRNIGTRRALATTFDKNADSARNPATKEMNRKIAADFTMDARKRVQGVDKAVSRLAKEETELDEAQITHSKVAKLMGDTKSRGEAIEKVKKTFKCSHEDACKHVDAVIDKSMKEEVELDEATNYKKVAVKSLDDFKNHAKEHGYIVKKVSGTHHQAWREGPHGGPHLAGVHFDGSNEHKAEKWMRIPKVNEEVEQIDEISKQLVARAYKKASDRSDLDLDDDMGEKAGKQADKFKARLAQHSPKREVPGRGEGAAKGKYKHDALNFPYRADAAETKKDGTLSKKAVHTAKYVAGMKLNKLKSQPKPNLPEEFELDEEIKPYVSGGHADGWSILDHSGKEVKKFHWKDYKDHPIKDKRKAAQDDAMAYFKKHFNSLRKPAKSVNEEYEEEIIVEGMIERDDFDDRVSAAKKAGWKVLDHKYTDGKAHISYVDSEGTHRTIKYTSSGKSVQNHGAYGGGAEDSDGKKVSKTAAVTVKRGRGRPKKDKFAEAVDILMSLSEAEFDELMEDSSLDEIVERICELSEEEIKEIKN